MWDYLAIAIQRPLCYFDFVHTKSSFMQSNIYICTEQREREYVCRSRQQIIVDLFCCCCWFVPHFARRPCYTGKVSRSCVCTQSHVVSALSAQKHTIRLFLPIKYFPSPIPSESKTKTNNTRRKKKSTDAEMIFLTKHTIYSMLFSDKNTFWPFAQQEVQKMLSILFCTPELKINRNRAEKIKLKNMVHLWTQRVASVSERTNKQITENKEIIHFCNTKHSQQKQNRLSKRRTDQKIYSNWAWGWAVCLKRPSTGKKNTHTKWMNWTT